MSVVLPDPDEPMSATISPGSIEATLHEHRNIHFADVIRLDDVLDPNQLRPRAGRRLVGDNGGRALTNRRFANRGSRCEFPLDRRLIVRRRRAPRSTGKPYCSLLQTSAGRRDWWSDRRRARRLADDDCHAFGNPSARDFRRHAIVVAPI